jgi:hypothetical protein
MTDTNRDFTAKERAATCATFGATHDTAMAISEALAKQVGAQLAAVQKRIAELEFQIGELEAGMGTVRFLAGNSGGKR